MKGIIYNGKVKDIKEYFNWVKRRYKNYTIQEYLEETGGIRNE